ACSLSPRRIAAFASASSCASVAAKAENAARAMSRAIARERMPVVRELPGHSFTRVSNRMRLGGMTIPILDAAGVKNASQRALALAAEHIATIHEAENVLDSWDDVSTIIEDAFGPISLLNSVHPDKDVRDACDDELVQESSFLT